MKRIAYILSAAILATLSVSCGSDDSFDPYKEQDKRSFYPKTLVFRSINDRAETDSKWTFTYKNHNDRKVIGSYTYTETITSGGTTITKEEKGTLDYYKNYAGEECISNKKDSRYYSESLTNIYEYRDTITEDVTISNNYITSITTTGKRTEAGRQEPISSVRIFNYANEFCTGSTFKDLNDEIVYTQRWSGDKLTQATSHTQSKTGSNGKNDTYEYSYDNRTLAIDYGFNLLAFIYGNNPQIYDAMGFFGKTTPYEIESISKKSYQIINGVAQATQSEIFEMSVIDSDDTVIYRAITPNYEDYTYQFNK